MGGRPGAGSAPRRLRRCVRRLLLPRLRVDEQRRQRHLHRGYGAGSIEAASAKGITLAASVLLGVFLHAVVLIILGMCWRNESRWSETREVARFRPLPNC